VSCGERRRRVLRSIELLGVWQPLCFNCHGQTLALDPMPSTMIDLRIALERERRNRDRRIGKADTRVFRYERRVGERRDDRVGEDGQPIDDDMIIEITVELDDAPAAEAGGAADHSEVFEDLTMIRELVTL
jgi:hypothetical protein